MRFSKWHAHGNVYLLTDERGLTPERVLTEVGDADGIVEVVSAAEDEAEVVIWNPDGSTAELSGNGTRIAARWLADRTGAGEVRIRVGHRETVARVKDGDVEQELGAVTVARPERIAGLEVIVVDVGNPHAVVIGDPDELPRIGPLLETNPRFPSRTNVQVARVDGPGEVTARVWERGVGETQSSGTSAVAVAAATHGEGDVLVHFPGGDLRVRLHGGRSHTDGARGATLGRRARCHLEGFAGFQQRLEPAEDERHAAGHLAEGARLAVEAVVHDRQLRQAVAGRLDLPRDAGGRVRCDLVVPAGIEAHRRRAGGTASSTSPTIAVSPLI